MATFITDITFERARFEKINRFYGSVGLTPQLSLLRIEEDLINGQGNYVFDLKKENLSPVERNLKRNDLFVTLAIGVATRIENVDKPNISVPMFAPHKAIVDSTSGDDIVVVPGFKTDDINALYGGKLYISTGTTVNFADLPTALFLKNKGVDDMNLKINHFDFQDDLKPMAEEIIFSGTQDHKVEVSFPTFAQSDYTAQQDVDNSGQDPVEGTNYKSKIVFFALGYRVVGGTLPSYRVEANPYKDCI